jgi:menaquinone-9 beta-reductase
MRPAFPVVDDAEIAVVGGGPAGAIAAFTLASAGHDVVIIDRHCFPRDKACGDAVASSAVSFLGELGLSGILDGAQPIDALRLTVDWQDRHTHMLERTRAGVKNHACCMPRRHFDAALLSEACDAGARLVRGYVTRLLRDDDEVAGVVLVNSGIHSAVTARYVLAADGATSRLRRELIGQPRDDLANSYAVRRYVRTDEALEPIFEIYVPVTGYHAGYGWVFPVAEHEANVGVGYVTARGLPRPRPITDQLDSFLASLQRRRGSELGALKPLGPPIGAPLGMGFSMNGSQRDGVIFVGDAARTCDPLTGEGIDQAMRGAHDCALALHRAISSRATLIAPVHDASHSNPRLGQDSATIARLGYELLRRRGVPSLDGSDTLTAPAPIFSAALAMLRSEIRNPVMADTPAGRMACQLGFSECLKTLDDRVRDQVRTDMVLASELLQRQISAGTGPVAAVTVFASCSSCGTDPDERAVSAAVAVELLRTFTTMLGHVTRTADDQSKASNLLAVTMGDHVLSQAIAAAASVDGQFTGILASAIKASSEAAALRAGTSSNGHGASSRYLEWARLTTGTTLSLAARTGARLAGAERAVEHALGSAGENLGIAVQICEDVLALTRDDAVTGRSPRAAFSEDRFSLPVVFGIAEPLDLAAVLAAEEKHAERDSVVDLITRGTGLMRAGELCGQYTESARAGVMESTCNNSSLLAICDLPTGRLPRALRPPEKRKAPSTSPDTALRLAS